MVLLVAVLLVWGCSRPVSGTGSTGTETIASEESTAQLSETEPTQESSVPERTLGGGSLDEGSRESGITLRVEGDRQTQFSGLCTVGDKKTVITGEVPKQFSYDLEGKGISCRIQKQDSKDGSLRVILLTGDTTRSVQQTNTKNGTINVSYEGG